MRCRWGLGETQGAGATWPLEPRAVASSRAQSPAGLWAPWVLAGVGLKTGPRNFCQAWRLGFCRPGKEEQVADSGSYQQTGCWEALLHLPSAHDGDR